MKGPLLLVALLSATPAVGFAQSATTSLVERLVASYDGITTLSCEIRRTTESASGRLTFLTRYYYRRGDFLHADTVSPLKRRIIADGKRLYSHIDGDARGFSCAIGALDRDFLISVRRIPGSPLDRLLRLRGLPEADVPPTTDYPFRKGYRTPTHFAVLSLDSAGRLARIEYFQDATLKESAGYCQYSQFLEVVPGTWIAAHHKTVTTAGGKATEIIQFSNISANQPIADGLFIPTTYFRGVEFIESSRYEDLYR